MKANHFPRRTVIMVFFSIRGRCTESQNYKSNQTNLLHSSHGIPQKVSSTFKRIEMKFLGIFTSYCFMIMWIRALRDWIIKRMFRLCFVHRIGWTKDENLSEWRGMALCVELFCVDHFIINLEGAHKI